MVINKEIINTRSVIIIIIIIIVVVNVVVVVFNVVVVVVVVLRLFCVYSRVNGPNNFQRQWDLMKEETSFNHS